MPKPPRQKDQSLADLRRDIDRIDEAMHELLIERGEIIDRLIAVKKTEETGSAFRPAREADMMRRLVARHHGNLPLDTAESIWRVIISTFTYVQAPFSVHADLSAGDALMRDSARFHFGFTVPFVPHMGAASVVEAVTESKGDLGLVPAFAIAGAGPWWAALEFETAPKIIARLPFVERADHPAAMPVFVVSRAAADAMVTETEVWSMRVSGWSAAAVNAVAALADVIAVPDRAFDGAALLVSVERGGIEAVADALRRDRRLDPLRGPRRQSRDPLYGARKGMTALPRFEAANEARVTKERETDDCDAPKPRPGVLDIEAYVPGKSKAPGVAKVFKLSSNETPLGPSPRAIAAYKACADHLRGLSGRLGRANCARRSGARSGSIPTASSAARAPTICCICWRTPISSTATRRSTPRTAF